MLTRTGRASTGSLPRAVPEPPSPRSLPGRRPYRHGPASQDEFRSRELRQHCMALRSARPLAKARSLPGSPSLPARALCRFYMLTRTGRASTGSLPRAVPEPPPPRLAAVIQEGVADLRVHPLDIPRPAVRGHSLQHPRITLPRQHMPHSWQPPARSPPSPRRSFWLEALTWPPPHRRASPRCGHPRRRCDPGSTPSMYLAPAVRGHIIQHPPTHNAAVPAIAHTAGSSPLLVTSPLPGRAHVPDTRQRDDARR